MEYHRNLNQFQLGLYQLNLRDEIAFDPQQTPQAPFGANRNLSPTHRYGITSGFTYQPYSFVSIDGQYNAVSARFINGATAGKRIPLVSEQIARIGVAWMPTEQWRIYTEALYTGNQYAANDDANVGGANRGIYIISLQYKL